MARAAIPPVQNDVLQCEALASGSWTRGTGVTVTDGTSDVADPNGGAAASKVVYDASGVAGGALVSQVLGVPSAQIGQPNSVGVWARVAAGSTNIQIGENASLGTSIVAITSTGWTFVARLGAVAQGVFVIALSIYRDSGDNAARTFYLAFAQAEAGHLNLGPYAKTTATTIPGPARNITGGRVPVSGRIAVSGRTTP